MEEQHQYASGEGHYFLLDPSIIDAMIDAGAEFDQLSAYITLAAFTNNRTVPKGTRSVAGHLAMRKYAGLSRERAIAATDWLLKAIHPETGEVFMSNANAGAPPRSRPHFTLQGVDAERMIALPSALVGIGLRPGEGQLLRISSSAQKTRMRGVRLTSHILRVAALRELLRLYERLDVERFGGSDPLYLPFGSAAIAAEGDSASEIQVSVEPPLPDEVNEADALTYEARMILRRTGAVRLFLAACESDGEVLYPWTVFGKVRPDWLPQAADVAQFLDDALLPSVWDPADGSFMHQEMTYRMPLDDDEVPMIVACPTLLPLTREVTAQKSAFHRRSTSAIEQLRRLN